MGIVMFGNHNQKLATMNANIYQSLTGGTLTCPT